MIDTAGITADLERDEGLRLFVYDDATGKPIVPGYTVIGHPTIGYGRALDVHGITAAEAQFLLADDEPEAADDVSRALPWFATLDPVRQDVLVEMTFNMGLNTFLGFRNTLGLVQMQDYPAAAVEMLKSTWARQVGDRAARLAEMMRTGVRPA